MLKQYYDPKLIEAGCDEAGRGCLAGPVFAAAVILHKDFKNELLNDSKKLNEKQRDQLKQVVIDNALEWSVAMVDNHEIDKINILNASFLAMHKAIDGLNTKPELLLIDGNRFKKYMDIDHHCIIKGDGKYMSIAAASVLAKTFRDEFMKKAHAEFPNYNWADNKGYPTLMHKRAIKEFGVTHYHRLTFNMAEQLKMEF
jgi:ribonuclease HII